MLSVKLPSLMTEIKTLLHVLVILEIQKNTDSLIKVGRGERESDDLLFSSDTQPTTPGFD